MHFSIMEIMSLVGIQYNIWKRYTLANFLYLHKTYWPLHKVMGVYRGIILYYAIFFFLLLLWPYFVLTCEQNGLLIFDLVKVFRMYLELKRRLTQNKKKLVHSKVSDSRLVAIDFLSQKIINCVVSLRLFYWDTRDS